MRRCLICTAPFRKRPRTTGLLCKECGETKLHDNLLPINKAMELEKEKELRKLGFATMILPDGRCEVAFGVAVGKKGYLKLKSI